MNHAYQDDTNVKNNKWPIWISLTLFSLVIVLAIYGIFIEPNRIQIHHIWIQDTSLKKILQDKTVIQLSDLHINKIGQREKMILKILDSLQPDFIFLTGDYVRWKGDYGAALSFLSQLKANTGVWAVMGDYDYSNSRKSCLFCHEEGSGNPSRLHSVRFLRDAIEPITLPHGVFWIGGIDYVGDYSSIPQKKFMFMQGKKPLILLCHNPLFFDQINSQGMQDVLVLAGDTHGGQVPLPLWLFRVLGYEKNSRYSQGIFERGGSKMYVNRGIGTSHLPIRLFRRPEVTVFHFH
jgi:predicted MPP superfamily phosphohydrolase